MKKFNVPVGLPLDSTPDTVAVSDAGRPGWSGRVKVRRVRVSVFDTGSVNVRVEAPKVESPAYETVAV